MVTASMAVGVEVLNVSHSHSRVANIYGEMAVVVPFPHVGIHSGLRASK